VKKIKKTKVLNGVFWIEIAEVSLKILCGSPADTVKHLIKNGMIHMIEENGIKFESGPNAILLSDLPLQNSSFSNMAEFPVLQMLYRQGMIIPNHPGNKGIKPLIIGSKEQVEAQMEYILRGNYGLISKKELMTTGMSEQEANEHMRMKLKFAFGKIRSTSELLDTIIVNESKTLIRNDVYIERINRNEFAISYKDERVVVDLNLSSDEKYTPPYSLGNYRIKREYFAVVHTGQGDGWDVNRPSMSSVLMFQGKIYLIDAGPNIDCVLEAIGIGIGEIEGIFQTHAHDDHCAGLTALMRSDHKIKYYSVPHVRSSIMKKISALLSMQEDFFYDFFEVIDLKSDTITDIEGLEVLPIDSPHPVETTIFIFQTLWEGGYKSYGHFADTTSFRILESMATDDPDSLGISMEYMHKIKKEYTQPLDIKKIDVGGGMIHGDAIDYKGDMSKRLILAHTSGELNAAQRELGSGAPFGTLDVLIESQQNYEWKTAHNFLLSYFDVPHTELRAILNGQIIKFNPETILIKEGETKNDIYLILTGNVEMIQPGGTSVINLSAGAIIGEVSGLTEFPCFRTYRATSSVQALRIPPDLYYSFVLRNDLYAQIETLADNRSYLERSWLFGDEISYPIQNRLADAISRRRCSPHEEIDMSNNEKEDRKLYLIQRGSVNVVYEGFGSLELSDGDFFGEEGTDFGMGNAQKAVCQNATSLLILPYSMVIHIPIVRLKLIETYKKRLLSVKVAA
jgi:hemerythrin